MSTIDAENPFYVPSPPIITFSKNLKSSNSAVIRSLPRIISYLPFLDFSTGHLHATIFVSLKSSKEKYTFPFFEVVNFLDWVSHIVFAAYFDLTFDVSLTITIVEMLPLSNIIQKFLNFSLPLHVFIHPFRIGEE